MAAEKQMLITKGQKFYTGGEPNRPESWSLYKAAAKRFSREEVWNQREHISAHTFGSSVLVEHADLCFETL